MSAHHNLFAHCNSRTPRFDGIRNSPIENVDFRNNVIYDWGENNVYAGEGGNYNIINNYYKWGPSTKQTVKYRIVNPYKRDPDIPFGKFFLEGNYVDGSSELTSNNWLGLVLNKGTAADLPSVKMNVAFTAAPIHSENARDAYEHVLNNVGAILPERDTLDQRIILEVRNRTGRMIDVQGGYPHGTEYEATVKAWPTLVFRPAPKDTDQDGMPDEWEQKNGLNPNDASDAAGFKLDKQYTNVEVYINSIHLK